MGNGYAILLWDAWGAGLVRVNPRLHAEGEDMYGNPKNWWPCDGDEPDEVLLARHKLPEGIHAQVIR